MIPYRGFVFYTPYSTDNAQEFSTQIEDYVEKSDYDYLIPMEYDTNFDGELIFVKCKSSDCFLIAMTSRMSGKILLYMIALHAKAFCEPLSYNSTP